MNGNITVISRSQVFSRFKERRETSASHNGYAVQDHVYAYHSACIMATIQKGHTEWPEF